MKKRINEGINKVQQSKLTKLLFDHPVIKFISLLIVEFITNSLSGYFPTNFPLRLWLIFLSILIGIYFVVMVVRVIRESLSSLTNPKNLPSLIGAYALLLLALILIFSTLFSFVELSELGYLRYGECSNAFDPSSIVSDPNVSHNYIYFSSITFFTVGYGDICPMGFARTVSILAAFTGNLVSVILVALIINNYFKTKKID